MRRIKIWLKSFTLMQQLVAIVFLSFAFLILFAISLINKNAEVFINGQMYNYIHRYQSDFVLDHELETDMIKNFIYNTNTDLFLNKVDEEYEHVFNYIDLDSKYDSSFDYFVEVDSNVYVYTISPYMDDYLIISFVIPAFRMEVESTLYSSVIGITLYVVIAIMLLIFIWVSTLIRPINLMKNYVSDLKHNKDVTLNIDRKDEIGALAESLTDMNKELSEQKKIRDEMIQNISHDLKTPIATIKSYSESIKDGIYPYDTLEKSVDVIYDNANRLEKKVYSLLTLNKMEYLKNENPTLLNLLMSPVIEKAILGCKVIRNDITIEKDVDDTVYFHGDEEPWRVVIENLLDNSLRYANSIVRISLEEGLLEIYNDGPQIEKERLDKLFTAYEMGNKGKFGLGLSIVKKVCDTYGYSVFGENLNDGVVFRIIPNKKMKKPRKERK